MALPGLHVTNQLADAMTYPRNQSVVNKFGGHSLGVDCSRFFRLVLVLRIRRARKRCFPHLHLGYESHYGEHGSGPMEDQFCYSDGNMSTADMRSSAMLVHVRQHGTFTHAKLLIVKNHVWIEKVLLIPVDQGCATMTNGLLNTPLSCAQGNRLMTVIDALPESERTRLHIYLYNMIWYQVNQGHPEDNWKTDNVQNAAQLLSIFTNNPSALVMQKLMRGRREVMRNHKTTEARQKKHFTEWIPYYQQRVGFGGIPGFSDYVPEGHGVLAMICDLPIDALIIHRDLLTEEELLKNDSNQEDMRAVLPLLSYVVFQGTCALNKTLEGVRREPKVRLPRSRSIYQKRDKKERAEFEALHNQMMEVGRSHSQAIQHRALLAHTRKRGRMMNMYHARDLRRRWTLGYSTQRLLHQSLQ
jgi:hypothetical protein